MSLVKCSDCENSISSSASSCPHCGNKMKKVSALTVTNLVLGIGLLLVGCYYLSSIQKPQYGYTINHIWPVVLGFIWSLIATIKLIKK